MGSGALELRPIELKKETKKRRLSKIWGFEAVSSQNKISNLIGLKFSQALRRERSSNFRKK